ncbi:MAG: hypothetical protein KDA37_07405 [Planctomycetales bacterium]|nr:hypothetical protein [Planctomycetales bacterium]
MRILIAATAALLLSGFSTSAMAQRPETTSEEAESSELKWGYESGTTRVDPLQMHMQKSAARAMQRQARIASLKWYGMSASRPTASAVPHTGLYSPQWQMPGGRPFAWYTRPYATTVYVYR